MILRGLTLWQPWATSIVLGPKRVENRPWHPSLRMLDQELWLALHAGKTWDEDGAKFIGKLWPQLPPRYFNLKSYILGVARVVQAVPVEDLDGSDPWSFGPWCWQLADVVQAVPQIYCDGHQGLWALPLHIEQALRPLCVRSAA